MWRSIVDDLQLDLRSGYVAGSTLYSSANEMETFQLLEKRRSGTLQLNFFGRPRGRSYYQILPPNALNYQITYTLDDSAGFGFACAVRPVTAPSHSGMMLALNGRLAAGTPLRLVAGNPAWLTHRDDAFSFRWFDGGISRSELGIWNVFAAKIGGEAAEPRFTGEKDRRRLPLRSRSGAGTVISTKMGGAVWLKRKKYSRDRKRS